MSSAELHGAPRRDAMLRSQHTAQYYHPFGGGFDQTFDRPLPLFLYCMHGMRLSSEQSLMLWAGVMNMPMALAEACISLLPGLKPLPSSLLSSSYHSTSFLWLLA